MTLQENNDYGVDRRITPAIVDLFAGPGGWDEALLSLGRHDVLGIEYDEPCCRTREAAGHATLHANVAELDPLEYRGIDGLIASPPCQAWSMAGNRGGAIDQPLVYHVMEQLMEGRDVRAAARADAVDERSLLVAEPLRWALAIRPEWIALEQVEPVADLWAWMADALRSIGYTAWSGVLSAERYGVPQTRRRAFLIARVATLPTVQPPLPTHQRYVPGEPAEHQFTLEGELLPWVSMAEALGWGMTARPSHTITGGGTGNGGGVEVYASKDTRNAIKREQAEGRWQMVANAQANACVRSCEEPAPTIKGGHDYNDRRWVYRNGSQAHAAERPVDAPAPTLHFGGRSNKVEWVSQRPATTVMGDPRVHPPGHKQNSSDPVGKYDGRAGENAVRVSLEQALVLQGFRPDYPVQGTKSQQFQQVGNAVPPPLAAAVLTSVLTPADAEVIPHAV